MDNKLFYVGQKALIVNKSGEILILITPQSGLDFPRGQVQYVETDLTESLI